MVPGNRLSLFVETSGESVIPIGTIHVVLNVFLPGPHDLHGTVDVLRDLDSANDAIGLQPSAEAAADQMVVATTLSNGSPVTFAAAAWTRAMAWLPTQISQPSLRT
jgi:hypothetical protein